MPSPTEILEFERRRWRHAGLKEQAIAEMFGLSPVRYYQALRMALDDPEAVAAHPDVASRLRRIAHQTSQSGHASSSWL